jgi:hypothetical protein
MQPLHWHKSTYSGDSSNCIQVAATPAAVHVRDSKNKPGPQLTVAPSAWSDFLRFAARARD